MKISSFLIILIFLLNVSGYSQQDKIRNEISKILSDVNVPGVQLIYSKNNKEKEYNVGFDGNGSGRKITSNTIFEAASLSKTVFAYAVLRLYDQGKIDLDTPLLSIIGNYKKFDNSNPNYSKITARMILRHTTGLPNWGNDSTATLLFTPDSCFSYSGEGYLYLQRVIEKLTNKSLNQIMQDEVFTPLHMQNSSYLWMDKYDTISSFGNSPEEINRHNNAISAYSLLTNSKDYSIFLKALLKGEGLKEKTHKMMFEKSTSATKFGDAPNVADRFISWGLGVGLQENEKGKAIWHWGDNGDYKCFYMVFPDKNESLVYFTHSRYGLFIAEDILNLFFGAQTEWAIKWLGCGYKSPQSIKALRAILDKNGYNYSFQAVNGLKMRDSNFELVENDLNELGFILLRQEEKKKAIEIFKLNLSLYPDSANAFDSLAEAYEADGDYTLAIRNYKQCLLLNPKNDYAAEHIKKLESFSK
jgi:CubicO group peptidase (beta-lactamase class C family)